MPVRFFLAIFGLFIDLAIWSLPHFVIWRLQLRVAHKVAISLLFGLGILILIMGILHSISLRYFDHRHDITYDLVPTIIWATARQSTAIIVTCCPLLRPLFEKLLPRGLTRITRKSFSTARKIHVTESVAVHPGSSTPLRHESFHDGFQEAVGPSFEVEKPEKRRQDFLADLCC
ncbi:hypothetical protein M011DRAFT_405696 [Sporormia fimetaria CBS 119925]|uniref:Rhodopsin domain-containing protein n=1 Tax=Sporormia fimetaria CBS 119925 TaxID=1340428 RepID=A0A6A6V7N0_9PLEO|nr:hypothetical protein M011DRAFT_405696 [Sporormia fimetaria CBS 119925]